jgi:hypothetical protein
VQPTVETEEQILTAEPEPTSAFAWTPRNSTGQRTVTLKLDADGNLVQLSERMQTRLREMAERGDWTGATGLPTARQAQAQAQAPTLKPTASDLLFAEGTIHAFSHLKQAMWAIAGLSKEKRDEILTYSKTQVENLKDPLAVVINKHSTDWFRKYREELQVLMILGVIELTQMQACTAALIKERKDKQRMLGRERDSGVTEIPQRREPREPRPETKASADEAIRPANTCNAPGCVEAAVPGIGYCRIHRGQVEAEA